MIRIRLGLAALLAPLLPLLPAAAQSPIALMGTCAQTEPLLKHACVCTVEKALAAGFMPAEVALLVKLDLMSVSQGKQQHYFAIKGQCLAETDPNRSQVARATPAPGPPAPAPAAPARSAPAPRQTAAAEPAPTRTSSSSGVTPLFMCQRTLSIVGDKCACMVEQLRKGGIADPVAVRLFGRDGRTATPTQADQFNRIVKGCSGYRTTVKGTASGATTARATGSATDSAVRPQPTARTTGQTCLLPPVMSGPPTASDLKAERVLFVSDNQMRGQLAALEGTRWRYPLVGMTGNELQASGATTTELQFGPDRLVTKRFVSEKQGTTEYRFRAIVVDEELGLDRECSNEAFARPDGSFAGSQGRRVRRQLILRPLDGKGSETELSIGYWGGNTLYVGENVRWQYFITPATLVSGTPKALKPVPSGAAVTRPSTPLAARIGDLGVLPKGYCDTMLWRQSAAIKTARQLAELRDKSQLQLVMADLAGMGGGVDRMTLIRFDGQMMNLAAVNEGGKTVWKSGDLLVTRSDVGQYALPNEPGVGFGDGVLNVRHGMESLTVPFVSQSVC
jgi:hypothetical protein